MHHTGEVKNATPSSTDDLCFLFIYEKFNQDVSLELVCNLIQVCLMAAFQRFL